jgi:hypothetical protein
MLNNPTEGFLDISAAAAAAILRALRYQAYQRQKARELVESASSPEADALKEEGER